MEEITPYDYLAKEINERLDFAEIQCVGMGHPQDRRAKGCVRSAAGRVIWQKLKKK